MKLICIGVGGTGAACIQSTVHLAALGLFPHSVELIPIIVDADKQHPRIQDTARFMSKYSRIRADGRAATVAMDGFLGSMISQTSDSTVLSPTNQSNLFNLLGLSDRDANRLSRLFFSDRETGTVKSRDFANGYYGRVNAGVCFFNDPVGRDGLVDHLRKYLTGGDSAVILIGSVFGGTGAAGLVHIARILRTDQDLEDADFGVAVVAMEPYFKPATPTDLADFSGLINLPATFESRTGASYQFLSGLADNGALPFHTFYPLGVRTPAVFPPQWFERDQQHNPPLFLEYVAALAVRDFALNHKELTRLSGDQKPALEPRPGRVTEAARLSVARVRRAAVPPYDSGPLLELRRHLWTAAETFLVLRDYVTPALSHAQQSKIKRLPGHPWLADIQHEAQIEGVTQLSGHFKDCQDLLSEILLNAGIDRDSAISQAGSNEDSKAKADKRNRATRESFPPGFCPTLETLTPQKDLSAGDPLQIFDSFVSDDRVLPVRAAFRWANGSLTLERGGEHKGGFDYQLTQQEDMQSGNEMGIADCKQDDEFHSNAMPDVLAKLAGARWKRPADTPRSSSEYPTLWAPALVLRDSLFGDEPEADLDMVQLGLLGAILVRREGNVVPPVKLIATQALTSSFQDSIRKTLPLTLPALAGITQVNNLDQILVIATGDDPANVMGFFYPDTAVVPAAGIAAQNREDLIKLGRFLAGRSFPASLKASLSKNLDWTQTLRQSGFNAGGTPGQLFLDFLDRLAKQYSAVGPALADSQRYSSLHQFPNAPPWIQRLYQI